MKGRDIYFACDSEFCYEEIHSIYGYETYAELRSRARKEGWSIGRENDYCPDHRQAVRGRDPISMIRERDVVVIDVPSLLDDGLGPHLGF